MRIIEVVAGFGAGGAETLLKDLSIGFKSKGHEVLVVVIDELTDDVSEVSKISQLRQNDIEIISLNRKPGRKSFSLFFEIYKIIKINTPDVVHIHSFLGALYFFPFSLFFSKCKFVQTIHSTHVLHSKWYKVVYSKILRLKYKNVFCSDESYRILNQLIGEGIVINNGIPTGTNQNIRKFMEKKFNIPANSLIILNVGRVSKEKNQILLLDIVEKLNHIFFKGSLYMLVCGKSFNDSLYRDIIMRCGKLKFNDNIKFIGVQDNISDLMYSSDLYISTSIYEGLPITVLEAMQTGVPLVLSPIKEHLNVFGDLEACYFPETNEVHSYVDLFKKNKEIFNLNKDDILLKRDMPITKYHINNCILEYLSCFNK